MIKRTTFNQIYDILAVLQKQKKRIALCKVRAHSRVKGNEEADKKAKQEIYMPGMATTRLLYTDHYIAIRRARNSK